MSSLTLDHCEYANLERGEQVRKQLHTVIRAGKMSVCVRCGHNDAKIGIGKVSTLPPAKLFLSL